MGAQETRAATRRLRPVGREPAGGDVGHGRLLAMSALSAPSMPRLMGRVGVWGELLGGGRAATPVTRAGGLVGHGRHMTNCDERVKGASGVEEVDSVLPRDVNEVNLTSLHQTFCVFFKSFYRFWGF